MALRPGIYVAAILLVGGVPWLARSQTPPRAGELRLEAGPPPRAPDSAFTASGPVTPTKPLRRLPPVDAEASFTVPDGISAQRETLDQAWTIALQVDQQLQAKRWDVSSAQRSLQSAQAQRWPLLAMESSYTGLSDEPKFRLYFPEIPLPNSSFPYAQSESLAFRTKVDVPLYTSGRIRYGIDAAGAKLTSAALEVEDSTIDLRLQVAEQYVTVLRAQREVEVTQSTVKSLEAHARNVEMLFKHDQVPRNDLLAAQVALANARQRTIQAHNRLDAGRAAYNRLLGRPLASEVRIAELPPETVEEDIESLTVRALRTRPSIASLAAEVQALRQQAASLLAQNGPQVELRGEYAFEENRFRSPEGIAAVGVGVSWNVFDGGRNRHAAAALQQQAEGLLRLREDLQSKIALAVRRAWLDIRETRRRLEVTPQAIRQAEENLRVAKKRYALGAGINTEVLDAETLRTETYRNHRNATYDAVLAVFRLRHATGDFRRWFPGR